MLSNNIVNQKESEMKKWLPPHGTKLTLPYIGVNDPRFTWSSGSDVQATWRKYGWTPPSEHMTPPPPEKTIEAPAFNVLKFK